MTKEHTETAARQEQAIKQTRRQRKGERAEQREHILSSLLSLVHLPTDSTATRLLPPSKLPVPVIHCLSGAEDTLVGTP